MTTRLPEATRQAVIDAQGGMCACGCGHHLRALEAATLLHVKLPKGRRAVEVDHVVPRSDGGSDAPENLQALTGWCHQAKIDAERAGYRRPVQSPLLGVVPSRGAAPAADNRARREAKGRRIGTRKRVG